MSVTPCFLVLLSGPLAVGKTTLRDFLGVKHGFSFVRSSKYLLEKAEREGLSADRSGLQELGDRLDVETDYRWVVDDVAVPAMAVAPEKVRWLVDAVRKPKQVAHFKCLDDVQVLHVHLTAPEDILRARYAARLTDSAVESPGLAYDHAIAHPNEVESRGLVRIADVTFDVTALSTEQLAEQVVSRMEIGNA